MYCAVPTGQNRRHLYCLLPVLEHGTFWQPETVKGCQPMYIFNRRLEMFPCLHRILFVQTPGRTITCDNIVSSLSLRGDRSM
jgi:hypothetical protein